MRKIRFFAVVMFIMMFMISCMSTRSGHVGMYPLRYVQVNSVAELQSAGFEIIGMVHGSGNVSIDDSSDGDTGKYGSLEFLEGDRMYYNVDVYDMSDPYFVALSNAIAEMTDSARADGAAFVTFPSYTIELIDGRVIADISAVAVKVINPDVVISEDKPIQAEITIIDAVN